MVEARQPNGRRAAPNGAASGADRIVPRGRPDRPCRREGACWSRGVDRLLYAFDAARSRERRPCSPVVCDGCQSLRRRWPGPVGGHRAIDRPGARLGQARLGGLGRSEEHTSELQSLMRISYAVFCLKKKTYTMNNTTTEVSVT